MNTARKRLLTLFALLIFACCSSASGEFTHPGAAHSQESIEFVKSKIEAGEQPWASAWQALKSSRHASLDWQPSPSCHVERGPSNNPDIGSSDFSGDAMAAYVDALCWVLCGEKRHADKSAEIVDAWSQTLKSISNHDARLLIGMADSSCSTLRMIRLNPRTLSKSNQSELSECWLDGKNGTSRTSRPYGVAIEASRPKTIINIRTTNGSKGLRITRPKTSSTSASVN